MTFEADLFWAVAAFAFGACVGSFLNVIIFRLPENRSIVFPSSRCPQCDQEIGPFDNIPILSYFILRGKCRNCNSPISFRYPLVEFTTATLCTALFLKFGLTTEFAVLFIFCAALEAVFWIDLDHMIIPDAISLYGLGLGILLVSAGFLPGLYWVQSLSGAILGGLILYVPAYIYEKVRHTEGLGAGDIKLLAMIGAFTGPYGVIFVLFFSSLVGSLAAMVGMFLRNVNSGTPIPFGPFLTAAAIGYVFFGADILDKFFELSALIGD
jgi:leader peptidase (prepilin peptidase)/N-methyltransferase